MINDDKYYILVNDIINYNLAKYSSAIRIMLLHKNIYYSELVKDNILVIDNFKYSINANNRCKILRTFKINHIL